MEEHNSPLISVIVPVYGVEPYLDQCVKSIVKQTYTNLEIILVDDGSKDKCPEMIDAWAEKDGRIRSIHKKNGGLSSARNAGLRKAGGMYVSFVDSDDWLEPDFIEKLFKAIHLYHAEVSVCGYKKVSETRKLKSRFLIESGSLFYPCSTDQAAKYFLEIAISAWGKLYLRDLIKDIEFVENRLAEDIPYQMEVLTKINMVAFCNKHLYNYRIRENSIAHTIKPKYLLDHIKSLSEAYDVCKKNFYFEIGYCCSWLSSLLYELLSAENFGKNEKTQDEELLQYALQQVGGEENLLPNIYDDLGTIFYTYSQFGIYMSKEEKRKIQLDYRKQFALKKISKYGRRLFSKYLPAYFSLEFTRKLSKIRRGG